MSFDYDPEYYAMLWGVFMKLLDILCALFAMFYACMNVYVIIAVKTDKMIETYKKYRDETPWFICRCLFILALLPAWIFKGFKALTNIIIN